MRHRGQAQEYRPSFAGRWGSSQKIVFAPETGVYKEPKDGVFLVENGRVYSKIRAVGLAAGYSWFLDPTAAETRPTGDDFPVLFVAPTQRDGWTAVPE